MTQDEFHENIQSWISKPKDTWNHITLMAYFCHKYKGKNKVRFRLVRWKGSPGLGKESRDFSKLFKLLVPEGYDDMEPEKKSAIKINVIKKIYNYINWMFDFKFRRGERSVTGTGIFLMPSMINEFERMYATFVKRNEDKDLVATILSWARDSIPEVFDLHQIEGEEDIRMVKRYYEHYNLSDDSAEHRLVEKAEEIGLL
jgi:hypothetical protein